MKNKSIKQWTCKSTLKNLQIMFKQRKSKQIKF